MKSPCYEATPDRPGEAVDYIGDLVDPVDQLVAHARARSDVVIGPPTPRPTKAVVLLTCMDARIDPMRLFGLESGDAHIVRNAGGLVTEDVIRSIAVSQVMLGTRHVMVMGHTGCGLAGLSEQQFLSDLEQRSGARPTWTPGSFDDVSRSVARSVEELEASPYVITDSPVRGFVYDVSSGAVTEIDRS